MDVGRCGGGDRGSRLCRTSRKTIEAGCVSRRTGQMPKCFHTVFREHTVMPPPYGKPAARFSMTVN